MRSYSFTRSLFYPGPTGRLRLLPAGRRSTLDGSAARRGRPGRRPTVDIHLAWPGSSHHGDDASGGRSPHAGGRFRRGGRPGGAGRLHIHRLSRSLLLRHHQRRPDAQRPELRLRQRPSHPERRRLAAIPRREPDRGRLRRRYDHPLRYRQRRAGAPLRPVPGGEPGRRQQGQRHPGRHAARQRERELLVPGDQRHGRDGRLLVRSERQHSQRHRRVRQRHAEVFRYTDASGSHATYMAGSTTPAPPSARTPAATASPTG